MGSELPGGGVPWLLALSAVALALFIAASWSGRWWLWLLAYAVTIVTLATAFLAGPAFDTQPIPAPDADPPPAEHSDLADPTARGPAPDSPYWRTA